MIEKFNNIFYLIIFLVHFLGVGVYAFQTIVGTKSFMEKFSIDPTGAIMIRLAGGFLFIVANGTKDWSVDREKKYVRL